MNRKVIYGIFVIVFFSFFFFYSNAAFPVGDVNGDGKVSANDYIMVRKHIMASSKLSGDLFKRADANGDGKVSTQDYIMIKKIIINSINAPKATSTPAPTVAPNQKPTAVPTQKPVVTPKPATPVVTQPPVVTTAPKKPTKMHFINAGSANAFLLESDGHFALIDSSNPYNDGTRWSKSEKQSVGQVIKYLKKIGVSQLDAVIASHSHSDHIGGMTKIAENFVNKNTKYYYRKYVENTDDILNADWDNIGYYNRSINAMTKAGAQLVDVTGKTPTFKLGDFDISILNTEIPRNNELKTINGKNLADGENKNSLVVYVKYGNYKTVFAGDMEIEDEMDIANKVNKVDVLQMGHHGGYTSSQPDFILKLKPSILVIPSDEFRLKYDFIRLSSVRLAQRNGAKLYITSKANDAIIANCNNGTCSFDSPGFVQFSVSNNQGSPWEKVDYNNESVWLYYSNNRYKEKEWIYDGGKVYYVDQGGRMVTGWSNITWSKGTNWFYFDLTDGYMVTGWQQLNWSGGTNWFYFDPKDGYMYANKTVTIDNKSYTFDSNGVCTSSGC